MRDFHFPGRSPVLGQEAMVATSHPLAAQAALSILDKGGNAMDAAIAGAILLGFCEPQMTGLGGDCFALFSPAGTDEIKAFNGSGRAPAGLSAQALRDEGHTVIPPYSAAAVTIPGAVDGFCTLSKDWGSLPWADLLTPSIKYAKEGVPVAARVAFDWQNDEGTLQGDARDQFMPSGTPPKAGDVFKDPRQVKLLEVLAADGRDGFYKGAVAQEMVDTLNQFGGTHTLDDFARAKGDYTTPVSSIYGDLEVVEHPPNGHGVISNLMLNMLKRFEISNMDPFGAERAHIEAEVAKLAYDARNRFVADGGDAADYLMAQSTADKLCDLIDPKQAMPDPKAISEQVHKDTIYITVVDKNRMSVSLIYSIFHGFGSGISTPNYGVLFQNRGAGFTLEAGHPNEAAGGKRPLHTIIPGMIRKSGRVIMPFGVMGGAYQPNGHARLVSNMVDFGMDPQSAIDAPRSFSDAGAFKVERGYSEAVRRTLGEMGHSVVVPDTPIGGAQAILIHDNGVLEGASDPRKDGCAIGA
ncbi:gamma-glutamyltransferase family protein [Nereida sp. MMG025]|uniref:gamma-glutamyltransferase family protein n=1 Tax=Nereida sp. MMG025 TaxID=2909981 RepID=UPI001F357FAE|nr:gamma-glutamyltransferase family protein [Nereida sp. MMG025]MCF6444811.1 gamma-glutamyltransferase family protein [Nereida sp. MMG025]